VNTTKPDLSSLLPDDATLNARRAALVDTVGSGASSPQPTPPFRRCGPRLALGGGIALAALAATLIVSAGGNNPPKAFAVEPQDGGGSLIKVYSPEDASGLEAALAEFGIRSQVTWLPRETTCREPRFTPSSVRSPRGGTMGGAGGLAGPATAFSFSVMSGQQWRERRQELANGEISKEEYFSSIPGTIALDPAAFRPDQSLVIWGSRGPFRGDPEGGAELRFGIAEGPVASCEPVSVAGGGVLGAMNRAVEDESAQHTAEATASGVLSLGGAAAAAAESGPVGGQISPAGLIHTVYRRPSKAGPGAISPPGREQGIDASPRGRLV
jgi:hypothetical protein